MSYRIERVAVIGAGTMGAAIAAHVANAGLPVVLLDIVPRELNPKEEKKGLTLEHPAVRNRIVSEGLERIAKMKPPAFMGKAARGRVSVGNLEDDFDRLAEADWIVEAIIEKLDIKRSLMERIDAVRKSDAIVTTNTSGLPISAISEGRSEGFRRHFFGTHFFNPPRYMKLLEIIPGDEADAAAVDAMADFGSRKLGKGIVRCKDTPNFIGNRLMSIHGSYTLDRGLRDGYRFEEIDAITGPLLGRPKTATVRLQDLVGVDVAAHVGRNLHGLIPDDEYRDVLASEPLTQVIGGLMERGHLGNKSGQGFYKKIKDASGKTQFLVLDPETFEYEPQQEVSLAAVGGVAKITDLGERLGTLFEERFAEDRGATLAWEVTRHLLEYAAVRGPEIAFDLLSIDQAVRWGFSYEVGPFELWDRLGVAAIAERMEASGGRVADWVKEMLAAGHETFYRREGGEVTGTYSWDEKAYVDLPERPRTVRVAALHAAGREVEGNASASLLDLGDGVLLAEFHSKMNAIDDGVVAMLRRGRELLDDDAWRGLVIGNDGPNFCVGANLKNVIEGAKAGQVEAIDQAIRELQEALQALRFAPKPVVAAVHAMALGGGAEIALAAHRIVVAAESYVGLVEVGVGLVPAGGGVKELTRRVISERMVAKESDPMPLAQKVLETIAMAKVSGSAAEAGEAGFLATGDRVVMNRDHLIHAAKEEVLEMAGDDFQPPRPEPIYVGGRDLLAALKVAVWSLEQAGWASAHDARIAGRVAWIISGGDLSTPQRVSEQYLLDLEREGFLELVGTEPTQDRIVHMLKTGKPLRN